MDNAPIETKAVAVEELKDIDDRNLSETLKSGWIILTSGISYALTLLISN